jgi:hypothetical protein
MANLLLCWPRLTKEERKTITFALSNHPPSRHLLVNDDWLAAAANVGQAYVLTHEVAIDALLEAKKVYGTAVDAIVEKLRADAG